MVALHGFSRTLLLPCAKSAMPKVLHQRSLPFVCVIYPKGKKEMKQLLFLFSLFALIVSKCFAQQFEQVKTEDLAKTPQRYWANGLVFRDVLESAPEPRVMELGKRHAQYVNLKTLGRCYADTVITPALSDLKTGREYLFAGTVLQVDRTFCVVIQGLVAQARDLQTLPAELEQAVVTASNNTYQITFTRMNDMLNGIESDLVAYSNERQIPLSELFNPLSTNRERTIQIVQTAVQSMSDQLKTTPSDILNDFLTAILAQRYPMPTNAMSSATPLKKKHKSKK